MNTDDNETVGGQREHEPFRVRIPGFVSDADIGIGHLAGRVAASIGIQSCGGCARRAEVLNKWLAIAPWQLR
jgi:hypothetical protein